MNKTNEITFEFKDVPSTWALCFCDGCPLHGECLRYMAGEHVPDDVTVGNAVYRSAYRNGECRHFKPRRIIRAAYGFENLFKEVKQKHYTLLREKVKAYLGSHGAYYRYNSGKRLLTPEQQQWILDLFAEYGYTKDLTFEHYRYVFDF